jgi:hypothetical protein
MSTPSESTSVRVHIVGAGPVGLLLSALLQPIDRFAVHLYEKRREYTRTRMVELASYLVADSVASYCTDYIDEESVKAIFEEEELDEGLAFRQSIPPDLMDLLRGWAKGFCPLNGIERGLSDLIDARQSHPVQRTTASITAEEAMAMLEPGDILIDCTGSKSLLRDQLLPGSAAADGSANTFKIRLEYALVVTFLYGRPYDCNEYCKYYKNIENAHYKFIPAVNRTYYDGSISHVTGIVSITAEDYERMPSRFDGPWLRSNFPEVPSRWTASSTRSSRKPTARWSATWRSSGSRSICTGLAMRRVGSGAAQAPATIHWPARRYSSSAIRLWALPTSSRFRWASSARCFCQGFSRSATWRSATCSIAMNCSPTSSGFGCTCGAS